MVQQIGFSMDVPVQQAERPPEPPLGKLCTFTYRGNSYDIYAGQNRLVLADSGLTAKSLLEAMTAQGCCCTQVDRWNPTYGRFDSYQKGFPFGDFPIEAGEEYSVTCEVCKEKPPVPKPTEVPWLLILLAVAALAGEGK